MTQGGDALRGGPPTACAQPGAGARPRYRGGVPDPEAPGPSEDGRIARYEAVGLYDPSAPDAADRLALLQFLATEGAGVEQMVEFDAMGRLPALAGLLRRRRGRTLLTPREVAAAGPFDPGLMAAVWRASGFPAYDPDRPLLAPEDLETFRGFVTGAELFGEEALLQFTRVMAAALASVADAAMATFGLNLQAPLAESGAGELEHARATANATSALVEAVPQAMATMFVHHVEAAVQRYTVTRPGARVDVAQLAVGFLDLEGSTALVQELSARDAGAAISDFEARASEVVADHRGRLVKTLGDEVMFVTTDAVAACEIALELCAYVDAHAVLPGLRGGLAAGELVRGYGDYYGPEVALAARAVKVAAPGTVLVTADVRDRASTAGNGLRFVSTGDHALRGFARAVELFGVERAPGEGG